MEAYSEVQNFRSLSLSRKNPKIFEHRSETDFQKVFFAKFRKFLNLTVGTESISELSSWGLFFCFRELCKKIRQGSKKCSPP